MTTEITSDSDAFTVWGYPDKYGRIHTVATFRTADEAVALARGIPGNAVTPGVWGKGEIHYTHLRRMETALVKAWKD